MHGLLPADFNQWALTNNNGWTVAHEAAERGDLPSNFDQWDLTNDKGVRVSDIAKEQFMQWKIMSEFEQNVADQNVGFL
jgi:hypothetical protein